MSRLKVITLAIALVLGSGSAIFAQSTRSHQESNVMSTNTAPVSKIVSRYIPDTHAQVSQRSVSIDGESASLFRYERSDGRNTNLGGEHFSAIVASNGTLKGFANISLDLTGKPLPSRERSEQIARDFLNEVAPDLLPRMKISWIDPHDEPILIERAGQSETVTLSGMKVKARNLADGRWFWVIIGSNEKPMVFERDIIWISFPGHRKTEKWLHDSWLKNQTN